MSIHNLQQRAALSLVLILSVASARSQVPPQDEAAAGAERSSARASGPSPGGILQDSSTALPPYGPEIMTMLGDFYGAVLVARGGAIPPPDIAFADQSAVAAWQAGVLIERATMGKVTIELQAPAMQALLAARAEVKKFRRDITPQTRTAARRNYADTLRFWRYRVESGLAHWVKQGRITAKESRRIRALAPAAQVAEILRLESGGLFFSSNRKKSILASAAPPGASQHLSMLALDIKEHENTKIRGALARHGWFQTVVADLSHFTFLGCSEEELPTLGLKKVTQGQRVYWAPDGAAASTGSGQ